MRSELRSNLVQWRQSFLQRSKFERAKYFSLATLLLTCLIVLNFNWLLPIPAHAAAGDMLLFWDPTNGAIPTDWCQVTAANGYFPIGADSNGFTYPTTVAGNAQGAALSPTVTSYTIGAPSAQVNGGGGNTPNIPTNAAGDHTTSTQPIFYQSESNGDASYPNWPKFNTLQLMMYSRGASCGSVATGGMSGAGIPTSIPAKAIAMFPSGGLPTGWTAYTSNDNMLVGVNNSVLGPHGGDTNTDYVQMYPLGPSNVTTTRSNPVLASTAASKPSHTHNAPTALTCASCSPTACTQIDIANPQTSTKFGCANPNGVPPYIAPELAINGSVPTPTLSLNMIAMFDADPLAGWQVISGAGQPFNNAFIRPSSTTINTATQQGNLTHSSTFTATSGPETGGTTATTVDNTLNLGGAAAPGHTHPLALAGSAVTNSPPGFAVVFAEKVSFTLTNYRWAVDPNTASNNVTDAWPAGTTLDLGEKTGIPAIPTAYVPPDASQGTIIRVRMQITVSGQALAANKIAFRLQYAKTNYNDCINSSSGWTNLTNSGGSTDWTYGTDATTDNSTITTNVLTGSTVSGIFSKSITPVTNPNAGPTGSAIEYDWLIKDNSALGSTQYAFRPVDYTDGDTLLSYYGQTLGSQGYNSTCPTVVTAPTVDQELRHGEFFQTNGAGDSDQGFAWAN